MARPPGPDKESVELSIQKDLLHSIKKTLPKDGFTGRARYGSLAALTERLYRQYLDSLDQPCTSESDKTIS